MPSSLAIGDFSRATHLTIKTLRHYHRIGLLEPADVDPATGHRRYTTDQIPTAQVIRRFRALDMPLEEIHAVITTPDLAARNELIAGHLRRLETTLARTQEAAASLRAILEPPADATPVAIEHRRMPAAPAAAVSEVIDVTEATAWYQGALGELHALLAAQKVPATGPGAAIYANDLFNHERGQATVFIPCDGPVRATGRVTAVVIPEVELALTVHLGPHTSELDLAYGSLASYVTEHASASKAPSVSTTSSVPTRPTMKAAGTPRSDGPSSTPADLGPRLRRRVLTAAGRPSEPLHPLRPGDQGPGGSLPGPDAGHPLHSAGSHEV